YRPGAWSLPLLKRVAKLPSRAWAGASALPEGVLLLATHPLRSRAVPLTDAEQLEPGTAVVVVVVGTVVLVVVVGLVVL
ncbi:hypothetical protein, partial [Mycobacterium sp.]|uniref:hypothetical protein n=1 Tax=Mycobacterium sp. TaxID=1785 RepID=UPI003F9DF116